MLATINRKLTEQSKAEEQIFRKVSRFTGIVEQETSASDRRREAVSTMEANKLVCLKKGN